MRYIVRTPEGDIYSDHTRLDICRFEADVLGVGSTIEQWDAPGEVLHRVTEESLADDYDLFND
ncbi:hypothetical protein BLA60_39510 [Actinophytocola xinjiangensis]|uniref:YD repeat-containing protein n=1 Tax=Actinophytocola xinjiangensis TaxID=485602 RepID=A0A7Z1AUY3_9PSEU|nr:hypothetical protein [Actinophytocola xinjiangensis]OLF04711.1 hypothetical protein BLA60_39510 [Actinophytocola xinjiangensis]